MTHPPPPPSPLYLAFALVDYERNLTTMHRHKVLHADPGSAHALDAASTREGDP